MHQPNALVTQPFGFIQAGLFATAAAQVNFVLGWLTLVFEPKSGQT